MILLLYLIAGRLLMGCLCPIGIRDTVSTRSQVTAHRITFARGNDYLRTDYLPGQPPVLPYMPVHLHLTSRLVYGLFSFRSTTAMLVNQLVLRSNENFSED